MKTKTLVFIAMLLLSCSIAGISEPATGESPKVNQSFTVFTSPDLYNLTNNWTSEFIKANPGITISVVQSSEIELYGKLQAVSGIAFTTNYKPVDNQTSWSMVVGRDVIVPIMNIKNPLYQEICKVGITSEGLKKIFSNPDQHNWSALQTNGSTVPLHLYMLNDPSVTSRVTGFLQNDKLRITGVTSLPANELITALQKDPGALAFCKLTDIIEPGNRNFTENISLVPIDKNGNGRIDFMEDIYGNPEDFARGVWIGKYPKSLCGKIFSVSAGKPQNESEVAFLNWVMTDGQKLLTSNGYSDLVTSERQTQLERINNNTIAVVNPGHDSYAIVKIILLVLIAFGLLGFSLEVMSRYFRKDKMPGHAKKSSGPVAFDENSMNIPKGLFFDTTHTWAFMEKDGSVKIGIDDFLQHVTGPLTHIEMRSTGEKIKKGERLLTMVSKGKQLNIYAPVSGVITAQNRTLAENASSLHTMPGAEGWVYTLEPANWPREIQFLEMAEKYTTWLKGEFSRLKDFIATTAMVNTPELATIALQDGGALQDNILAGMSPEVWEDFQTQFIDCNK
ncbi:MAG: hypothetical protein ACOYNC_01900 [Bacteroidales bacterium]